MTSRVFEREFRELPLAIIRPPSVTARTRMSEEKMDSLVQKIRTFGFQSVIGVFPIEDEFEVVFGHRRRIAAERAGLVAIPCFVYPSRDKALEALKHMENAEREEMRPSEEAVYFDELLQRDADGDMDKLAAQLSLKRDYIDRRLSLLSGHEDVYRALDAEEIGVGVAEQLNRVTDLQHVRYLLHEAIAYGWTVGIVTQAVHEWKVLHQHVTAGTDPSASAVVAGPPTVDPYFTCRVCGLTENPGNMRPVQIHDYCQQAVFLPALEFFQRRSDYVRRPRTDREALALLEELMELFPSLGSDSATAADPAARS